jgi:hypothetical protein
MNQICLKGQRSNTKNYASFPENPLLKKAGFPNLSGKNLLE